MLFSNPSPRVSQVSTNVQTQQHVDRRAAKRTAASLVVHFVGTRLTEALITARHQRDACITWCYETHLAEVNTAAALADTVVAIAESSLVSSSF